MSCCRQHSLLLHASGPTVALRDGRRGARACSGLLAALIRGPSSTASSSPCSAHTAEARKRDGQPHGWDTCTECEENKKRVGGHPTFQHPPPLLWNTALISVISVNNTSAVWWRSFAMGACSVQDGFYLILRAHHTVKCTFAWCVSRAQVLL